MSGVDVMCADAGGRREGHQIPADGLSEDGNDEKH